MSAPDPTAGERACAACDGSCGTCPYVLASPPAVAASTGTSEDVEALAREVCVCTGNHDPARRIECDYALAAAKRVLASDWLAAREAAARAEERDRIAQADRCGGCKGQGSHRRHCPRHPNYHPWIPLADRAESIGDSIGEPGLANQAWALAAAIRDEMPNHPYRPARHSEAR